MTASEPPTPHRFCFVGTCEKPDVNAPDEGTWPTCSDKVPACAEHLYLVPLKQRHDKIHAFTPRPYGQRGCWYCGAVEAEHCTAPAPEAALSCYDENETRESCRR